MIFEPVAAFAPCEFRLKHAVDPWERAGAAALRKTVFCEEQKIFAQDDRDAIDDMATALVAVSSLGCIPYEVVGTVRIHEAEPGVWFGSRLAVAGPYRRVGALGAGLIRLAVGSAHARGATRFLAHVQEANEPLFRKLDWRTLRHVDLHGRRHAFMEADLAAYPPIVDGAWGFVALAKPRAALPLPKAA